MRDHYIVTLERNPANDTWSFVVETEDATGRRRYVRSGAKVRGLMAAGIRALLAILSRIHEKRAE